MFYDGEQIAHQVPPLGFWLGDEGSGGHLGKQLVLAYLHKDLPMDLRDKFEKDMAQKTVWRFWIMPIISLFQIVILPRFQSFCSTIASTHLYIAYCSTHLLISLRNTYLNIQKLVNIKFILQAL
jgi:hypothetical protein